MRMAEFDFAQRGIHHKAFEQHVGQTVHHRPGARVRLSFGAVVGSRTPASRERVRAVLRVRGDGARTGDQGKYLTTANLPENYQRRDPQQTPDDLIGGGVIISLLGDVLAGPVYGKEALLVADLDLDDQIRGKYDPDVTGHYSRPDVFTLTADRSARNAVVSASTSARGSSGTP